MIRQRLMDDLQPLGPLTVLCGIPGSGKNRLIHQLYEEMSRSVDQGRQCVLMDFPQRYLGDKSAVALMTEALLRAHKPDAATAELIRSLRRGQFDLDDLHARAARIRVNLEGVVIFLPNYEWQASPILERLLVGWVRAGADVVCSLLDADSLVAEAQEAGIVVRVISDADLCFDESELAKLAASMGIEPTPDLIARVARFTAGHPVFSAVTMLRLAGVEKMVMEHGTVRFLGQNFPAGGSTLSEFDQENRLPGRALTHVEVLDLGSEDVKNTAGALRYHEFSMEEFQRCSQGSSPFVVFTVSLLEVPWADLDALDGIRPGCGVFVQRLSAAGYARMEFGEHPGGLFVWNADFRALCLDWIAAETAPGAAQAAGAFLSQLAEWYGDHGHLMEATQLLAQNGDSTMLEAYASAHFVDFVTDGRSHGFSAYMPSCVAAAVAAPAMTILAATEAHPLARDDREVAALVSAVVSDLREGGFRADARERLHSSVMALVALMILDRWDDVPDLGLASLQAMEDCLAQGILPRSRIARTYALLGVASFLRADFITARTTLTRAVALLDREEWASRITMVALIGLEGYFGETLFSGAIDREAVLKDCTRVVDELGAFHRPMLITSLARSWRFSGVGEYERALDTMSQAIREAPRSITQPFVVWTYGLQLLLNGRFQEAHSLFSEVDERVKTAEETPRSSATFVLGAVLACVADRRLHEAVDFAARRDESEELLDQLTRVVIATAAGWKTSGVTLRDCDPRQVAVTARVRTLVACVQMALLVGEGRTEQARETMRSVVDTSSPSDVDLACRFMTRQGVERLCQLAQTVVPGSVTQAIADAVDGPHVAIEGLADVTLSHAQLRVLDGLRRDLSNQEIADELFLSVNTVKTHLREIYRRLGAKNRRDAVALAEKYGLIER